MKKILIITYYWLPSGGSGVQRWVKFTKYLRKFGVEPVIYVPENPEYPSIDHSMDSDIPSDITILKRPIWEPYNIYRKLIGKKGEAINAGFISEKSQASWKDRLSIWIRGNFLIPDPRVFWIRPSVKFLSKYITENDIDTVITTGPPHSMHFIGYGLKKKNASINWIADFRDPWTKIYFYKDLNLSYISDKIHHFLENKILQKADKLIVVSNGMKKDFEQQTSVPITVISNGYDNEQEPTEKGALDTKFTLSHIGLLTQKQNPLLLWKVLKELCDEFPEFKKKLIIRLVGKIDYPVIESIENAGLLDNLEKLSYVPHTEALKLQQASQVLLLLLVNTPGTENILTGKLFEYLNASRPIFCVAHVHGDAATIIRETNAGVVVGFDELDKTKKAMLQYYNLFKKNELFVESKDIEKYSRENLTKLLVNQIMDKD
ncbi:MAG: glycosyltransferase [Paludibacter sp.]|nr:glycosyltransferase [Paludibacter sp.]